MFTYLFCYLVIFMVSIAFRPFLIRSEEMLESFSQFKLTGNCVLSVDVSVSALAGGPLVSSSGPPAVPPHLSPRGGCVRSGESSLKMGGEGGEERRGAGEGASSRIKMHVAARRPLGAFINTGLMK